MRNIAALEHKVDRLISLVGSAAAQLAAMEERMAVTLSDLGAKLDAASEQEKKMLEAIIAAETEMSAAIAHIADLVAQLANAGDPAAIQAMIAKVQSGMDDATKAQEALTTATAALHAADEPPAPPPPAA